MLEEDFHISRSIKNPHFGVVCLIVSRALLPVTWQSVNGECITSAVEVVAHALEIHPQLRRLKQACHLRHHSCERGPFGALCRLLLSHLTDKSAELALLQSFSISRLDASYDAKRKTGDSFVQKYAFQCLSGNQVEPHTLHWCKWHLDP